MALTCAICLIDHWLNYSSSCINEPGQKRNNNLCTSQHGINPFTANPVKALHFAILV